MAAIMALIGGSPIITSKLYRSDPDYHKKWCLINNLTETPGSSVPVTYHYKMCLSGYDCPAVSEQEYRQILLDLGFEYTDESETYWKDLSLDRDLRGLPTAPTFPNIKDLADHARYTTTHTGHKYPYDAPTAITEQYPCGITNIRIISDCEEIKSATLFVGGAPVQELRAPWHQFVPNQELPFFGEGAIIPVPYWHQISFSFNEQCVVNFDVIDLRPYPDLLENNRVPGQAQEHHMFDNTELNFERHIYAYTNDKNAVYNVNITGPDRGIKVRLTGQEGPVNITCHHCSQEYPFVKLDNGDYYLDTAYNIYGDATIKVNGNYAGVNILICMRNIMRYMHGMAAAAYCR